MRHHYIFSFFATGDPHAGGKTVDAGQTASGKGLYPTCPDHPLAGSTKNHTLKEWIIAGLKVCLYLISQVSHMNL